MRRVALIFLGAAAACHKEAETVAHLTPVRVHEVASVTGGSAARYSASIKPDVQVDVAFKVGGYVTELLQVAMPGGKTQTVQAGDSVKKGAVLARLRDGEYTQRVTEAQSAVTQARADLDRASQLYENQNISKAEYDSTYAKSTSAQARLEQAILTLRDATLTAPMDGTVMKRSIEVGTLVSPGITSFVLADTRAVRAVFGVPDVAVVNMKIGDALELRSEALPGVDFSGNITRIAPSADPSSRVFDVECTIPNPDGKLKAGMVASLKIAPQQAETAASILVPLNAIVRPRDDAKGYAVFVLEEKEGQQIVHERRVRPGGLIGNQVAVLEGLQVGEKVVVAGATLIRDGELVRVVS